MSFKKFLYVFIFIILLVSCYKQTIILNPDKNSGKMIIEYNLDDDYFQLVSIAAENILIDSNNKFDPLILIDKDLFKETFKDTENIKLKSVNIDTSNGYKGNIVIEFNDLEKILASLPAGLVNLTLKKESNNITLTQILDFKKMDPDEIFKNFVLQQKEDDINFYNRLTKEAKFTFIIKTMTPIKYTEGVGLSKDKKQAIYTFTVNDFINSSKILKFIISL
jgi:hypothetical protein